MSKLCTKCENFIPKENKCKIRMKLESVGHYFVLNNKINECDIFLKKNKEMDADYVKKANTLIMKELKLLQ